MNEFLGFKIAITLLAVAGVTGFSSVVAYGGHPRLCKWLTTVFIASGAATLMVLLITVWSIK